MWPIAFVLDDQERYLLWINGDGVHDKVLATGGTVRSFDGLRELHRYVAEHGLHLEETGAGGVLDIDAAERWCGSGSAPDAVLLLQVWNLCSDVARGAGRPFEDRGVDRDRVYDVLFHGNNLPSMTPPGDQFVPDWTSDDLETLREVIQDGVSMLRSAVDTSR